MGKPSSPRSDKELLQSMGEEAFHNSFCRLPDEKPIHKWDTDEAVAHAQRMRKLDRQLAKYNQEIAMLKDMLKKEDENCEAELERLATREQNAQQEIVEMAKQHDENEREALSNKIQFSQLQTKLAANTQKIKTLRHEGKNLTKELRRQEKQMEKLNAHNIKLEESSASLLASYSALSNSKVFEDSNTLHDALDENMDTHHGYKEYLKAMQDRYMNEAQQRLELQQGMAEILHSIHSDCTNTKLANACNKVGMECEERAHKLIAGLEAEFGDAA